MKQKQFEQLSFEKVKTLNGKQENEAVLQAWRAGYIHLQQKLGIMSGTMFNDEFMYEIDNIIEQELDAFKEF